MHMLDTIHGMKTTNARFLPPIVFSLSKKPVAQAVGEGAAAWQQQNRRPSKWVYVLGAYHVAAISAAQ
jgi:hypothetical protein